MLLTAEMARVGAADMPACKRVRSDKFIKSHYTKSETVVQQAN